MKLQRRGLRKALNRVAYLTGNFVSYALVPNAVYRAFMRLRFAVGLSKADREEGRRRAAIYCCVPSPLPRPSGPEPRPELDGNSPITLTPRRLYRFPWRSKHRFSSYFFDLYQAARWLPGDTPLRRLFGDIDFECPRPTLVKSRPVATQKGSCSVVCRLDRLRHFTCVADPTPWSRKKDMLVSRNVVNRQPWRDAFIDAALKSPLCDAGQVNPNPTHPERVKPFMSVARQLDYKFIACIEGHDVATNLKWVMSSNSLAVMPRPRVESWFMEGSLEPGVHYVEVKADYSDLDEKLRYYLAHPDEAERILANAHAWVDRFRRPLLEKYVHKLVAEGYARAVAHEEGADVS